MLTEAISLIGDEAGKEHKTVVRTIGYGEKIYAFHAREQRPDEGCIFMDVKLLCNYAYNKAFGRVDKKRAKK